MSHYNDEIFEQIIIRQRNDKAITVTLKEQKMIRIVLKQFV